MEVKTNSRTGQILDFMYILAWVAFIGLMIEAGAILISYGVSCVNPEAARNLYKGMDLYPLRHYSFWYYTQSVSLIFALSAMKSFILFLVIKTLSKVNLKSPFTIEVARTLEKISYVFFGTWIIAIINNAQNEGLLKRAGIFIEDRDAGEFLFMAGLVFIISQVFKRGVELQSENELTV